MKESPQTVSNVQRRGSKGDFIASIIRNDPRDRRLAKSFKTNYDFISKNTAVYSLTDQLDVSSCFLPKDTGALFSSLWV